MQAQHDLGEAEARPFDRDAHLAGQRHFEAAAEAETVDHGDGRNAQCFEAVDHRMGAADRGFHLFGIGRAAEFVDVGAGDEARGLRRADDETGRALRLEVGEHAVEAFDHFGRQGVGAGIGAVEQQPGDAVGIAGEAEIVIRPAGIGLRPQRQHAFAENIHELFGHRHTISISMAPPSPPPMHSVAIPRRVPSRFMALTRCSTIRLPEVPTG